MNRRTLLTLAAVMALGLISQTAAEAGGGGGGSKKNATVKVYNTQPATEAAEGVLFLASGKAVPTTQPAFTAAGGKPVSPSPKPVTFTVAPGAGTIYVTDGVADPVTLPYAFSAGKTYTYTIGGNNDEPTITKQ